MSTRRLLLPRCRDWFPACPGLDGLIRNLSTLQRVPLKHPEPEGPAPSRSSDSLQSSQPESKSPVSPAVFRLYQPNAMVLHPVLPAMTDGNFSTHNSPVNSFPSLSLITRTRCTLFVLVFDSDCCLLVSEMLIFFLSF